MTKKSHEWPSTYLTLSASEKTYGEYADKLISVLSSEQPLHRQLTKVKDTDPVERRSYVMYKILCNCGCTYIRETKTALEMRLREHKAVTRRGELEKSAIAEHAWKHDHLVLWDQTRVLDEATNTTSQKKLYISDAVTQANLSTEMKAWPSRIPDQ